MSETQTSAPFGEFVDLASAAVGGAAIACNDDFFAPMENLVKPGAAVWNDDYTERGKWMDGWETRRRRNPDWSRSGRAAEVGGPQLGGRSPMIGGPQLGGRSPMIGGPQLGGRSPMIGAHEDDRDWCVVRLGLPGIIRGIVVDTAWFRGNFPSHCAVFATAIDDTLDLTALASARWTELVPRSPLTGDAKTSFAIDDRHRYTHVRLEIFPDGGVARLRVHGEVVPEWSRLRAHGSLIDLAALDNGAVVDECSDMFFGSRNHLIKSGPSHSMADGWETRRRRGPGNDWAVIRLASTGTIEQLEIDTSHFKGNAPERVRVEGTCQPGTIHPQATGWRMLVESRAQPHTRHLFVDQLRRIGPVSHLRLSVFPCGGVARLRAWGLLHAASESAAIVALNRLAADDARAALLRCCGARGWADAMTAQRPFEDIPALLRIGERVWWSLDEAARREAFAAHAKIGESIPAPTGGPTDAETTAKWSRDEQRGTAAASERTASELARLNREYADKHGFIFIVCATGRSADDMLAELAARIANPTAVELVTASEEQCKITRLRLHKMLGDPQLGGRSPAIGELS